MLPEFVGVDTPVEYSADTRMVNSVVGLLYLLLHKVAECSDTSSLDISSKRPHVGWNEEKYCNLELVSSSASIRDIFILERK